MSEGLPHGWVRIPLRDLGTWYGGGTPSKSNDSFWTDGTIPWLSPKDMGADSISGTIDHITAAAVEGSATKLVPAQSVAVVVRSGILERTLPVGLVPFRTTLNQDMKAVVAREGVEPGWIAWGLRAYEQKILRECSKRGTTVASLDSNRLMAFELPVPPVAEQRRIVAALDEQLSRLDAAGEAVKNAATRANQLHRMELRRLTRMHGSQVVRLDSIAEVRLGRQRSPKNHVGDHMRPYLRAANVGWTGLLLDDVKEMNFTDEELEVYRLRAGDIILGEASGSPKEVGKPAIWNDEISDCCIQNTLLRVRPVSVNSLFLLHYLRAEALTGRFVAHSRGVGIYHLGAAKLAAWPVALPSKEQQEATVVAVDEAEDRTEAAHRAVGVVTERGRHLRFALLKAAYSGKLVPSGLNDQPASFLLERIQSERHAMNASKTRSQPENSAAAAKLSRPAPSTTHVAPAGIQEELPL